MEILNDVENNDISNMLMKCLELGLDPVEILNEAINEKERLDYLIKEALAVKEDISLI